MAAGYLHLQLIALKNCSRVQKVKKKNSLGEHVYLTYIFFFTRNGFTQQFFDRHEAVPVIHVLSHSRGESGESYLPSTL